MFDLVGFNGFLDRSIEIPPKWIVVTDSEMHEKVIPNIEYLAWKRSDRLLKGWITGPLSKEIVNHVAGLESAKGVWKALKNAYSFSTGEREFALYVQMQLLKRDQCESLQHYINKFKNICDELQSIECPLPDHRKVFWL